MTCAPVEDSYSKPFYTEMADNRKQYATFNCSTAPKIEVRFAFKMSTDHTILSQNIFL